MVLTKPFIIQFPKIGNSSLGYIGCGLMFILPNLTLRRIGYLTALLPIVGAVFYYIYSEHTFFKMRVDDTYNSLKVIQTGKFDEKTNLSSFVMIGNLYIARKNVADHPLGSGIGSHHYMHTENYLKEMRPPEYLRIQKRHTDNSFDANSLATRLFSEFGIIGIIDKTSPKYSTVVSILNVKSQINARIKKSNHLFLFNLFIRLLD